MPRVKRPPAAACAVSACCAIATGWRGKVGTTAVPSSIRLVARAHKAATMIASAPKMFANHPLAKPSVSARRACATRPSRSVGAPAMSPMPIPILMVATLPAGQPRGEPLETIDVVRSELRDRGARVKEHPVQLAVRDIDPAVGAEAQAVGPDQARVAHDRRLSIGPGPAALRRRTERRAED